MRKFECISEACGGNCELTINCDDLEDQLPAWCPSVKALRIDWKEIAIDPSPHNNPS